MNNAFACASLLTYTTLSNTMLRKKSPNKIPCMWLDGRKRTGYWEIRKSFMYKNYCLDKSCYECKYREYICRVQEYKSNKVSPK